MSESKVVWEYDPYEIEDSYDWESCITELDCFLKKTRIKHAFLEITNGGWRQQHGIGKSTFELTAENLIDKIRIHGDFRIVLYKDGRKLKFIRYSHDEPTGATIHLHPASKYKSIYEQVYS